MTSPSPVLDACVRIRDSISLSSIAARHVKLMRSGHEWKARCPFHEDKTPSFTIYDDDRRFQCFGCGAQGDVLDYVQQSEGVTLVEAIKIIDADALPMRQRTKGPSASVIPIDRKADAMAIWQDAVDPAGTEAEAYLASRRLGGPIPPAFRFARLTYGQRGPLHPVLVALVVNAAGEPQGIQRTYLAPDGRGKLAVDKPKLSLGRVKGGAIRLAPAHDRVILAEGMEDALTLQRGAGLPAWAAAGAGMLPFMNLPSDIRSVIIGADADPAGRRSAQDACDGFKRERREVRIIWPEPPHKDFNAELCASRGDAA